MDSINNLLNEIFGTTVSHPQEVNEIQLPSIPEHGQSLKTVRSTLHQSSIPILPDKRQKIEVPSIEEEVNQLFEPSQEDNSFLPEKNESQTILSNDELIRVKDRIPPYYHSIIPFEYFNRIQSKVCDSILQTNTNIVISAPTGCGKTVILELAVIKLHKEWIETHPQSPFPYLIIYVSPTKALCREVFTSWSQKFSPFGLQCIEITGDTENPTITSQHHIVFTTPEKLEILSRRWSAFYQENYLVNRVKLLLIDEIHILNEPRGGNIETIIARLHMRKAVHQEASSIRMITLSATLPNGEDVAQWLHAIYFSFDASYRPVPIDRIVLGFPNQNKRNPFLFEKYLNYKVYSVIQRYSMNKPVMVFSSTRKGCISLANQLVLDCQRNGLGSTGFLQSIEYQQGILPYLHRIEDTSLKEWLRYGIAIHTAGLSLNDRSLVESLFEHGYIHVICTTSTLALGVNLPVYLVIIKGTTQWKGGGKGYEELSDSMLQQMIGRAGRPQFNEHGIAVILTSEDQVMKYQQDIEVQTTIESNLTENLTECINNEIVLRSITNSTMLFQWIQGTFYYIRVHKNPEHYHIVANPSSLSIQQQHEYIDSQLKQLLEHFVTQLKDHHLILIDSSSTYCAKLGGILMQKFYLKYETTLLITSCYQCQSEEQFFLHLACAMEFIEYPIKQGQKSFLNLVFSKLGKFHYKGKVKAVEHKIVCLLMCILGGIKIEDMNMVLESESILQTYLRICKATLFYLTQNQDSQYQDSKTLEFLPITNKPSLLQWTHQFIRALTKKTWGDEGRELIQFDGIGPSALANLSQHHILHIDDILTISPSTLDSIIGRKIGFQVIQQAESIPHFSLSVELRDSSSLVINITGNSSSLTSSRIGVYTLIVSSNDSLVLLYKQIFEPDQLIISFSPNSQFIKIVFLHNQWIGLDELIDFPLHSVHHQPLVNKTEKKRKRKKEEKKEKEENQEEIDLLNFISWDDSSTVKTLKKTENIKKQENSSNMVNLDLFLNSCGF